MQFKIDNKHEPYTMRPNLLITSLLFFLMLFSPVSYSRSYNLNIGTIDLPSGFSLYKKESKKNKDFVFEFNKINKNDSSKTFFAVSAFNYRNHKIELSNPNKIQTTLDFLKDAYTSHRKKYTVTNLFKPRMITIDNIPSAFALLEIESKDKLYIGIIATTISGDYVLTFTSIIPGATDSNTLTNLLTSIENFKIKN